jgi:hypothetical protein
VEGSLSELSTDCSAPRAVRRFCSRPDIFLTDHGLDSCYSSGMEGRNGNHDFTLLPSMLACLSCLMERGDEGMAWHAEASTASGSNLRALGHGMGWHGGVAAVV